MGGILQERRGMRGCRKCSEIEPKLAKLAFKYWKTFQAHSRLSQAHPLKRRAGRLLNKAKTALDQIQQLYNTHVTETHAKTRSAGAQTRIFSIVVNSGSGIAPRRKSVVDPCNVCLQTSDCYPAGRAGCRRSAHSWTPTSSRRTV